MLQAAEGEVHLPPVCRSLQRLILFVAVLGLAPGLLRGAAATRTNLTFDASVTVVESGEEPAPVRRATEDLLNDFSKVFGQRPALAIQLEEAGPIAILIADRSRVHAGIQCPLPTGTESFAFSTVRVPGRQPLKQIICLTGADMRGTIYAIYQFSQTYLGVDPMYLWTDKQPEKRTFITLPANFARVYPKPVFQAIGDSFPTTKIF